MAREATIAPCDRFRDSFRSSSRLPPDEQRRRTDEFYQRIAKRRTVRDFSDEPVPWELVRTAIRAAATAPSGANRQPWRFVVVSDPAVMEVLIRL